MQIKLVLLTICASLVAIGFATPSPQGSRSGGELGFGIPNDEQSPGIDNLSLTGGSGESDEVMSLGDPDNESMAVLTKKTTKNEETTPGTIIHLKKPHNAKVQ
ncbi:hypothetical protein CU097_008974 [Rhizopus azygosporus]|uniref:Secreted protein n=1 Tax=Rhizopus azygosporus TaxID=86630 RepID=A0A367KFK1_RHIAZ|nr:hypothetical protein CU097_008974 [Rhizopus azygosporus]